ncbi:hypothetical protein [Vibrio algivorus]|uniref:Uncharacterized protein n=1 Tax=Vibrio algivorus TaxID=1667024 RepID=A0A557P5E7_9VIBR|nr:hypothetical protein [Vibrio algivorus]TVO35892.1 hypothetical protein FOF44_10900 [Vibrio algivorus]
MNQFQPMPIDWNRALGKMVANTTTVAGLLTASPIYGPMGRLNGKGIIVSVAVGASLALMGKRPVTNPLLCYGDDPDVIDEHQNAQ